MDLRTRDAQDGVYLAGYDHIDARSRLTTVVLISNEYVLDIVFFFFCFFLVWVRPVVWLHERRHYVWVSCPSWFTRLFLEYI